MKFNFMALVKAIIIKKKLKFSLKNQSPGD